MAASKSKKMMKSLGGDIPVMSDDAVAQTTVFPALEDFSNTVIYDEIYKWTSLPLDQAFRILAVKEITCRNTNGVTGAERVSRFAKLEDVYGVVTSVWLPGTVEKKLLSFPTDELESGCLYIRSLGPKVSKTTGHTYHNFGILKC